MNAEGGGADTTCRSSPRRAAAQRWSCRAASGSGTVSRSSWCLGTAGRPLARAGVVRPAALHAARPSDLSCAAARAAAPQRALMWDRRRISEGLRACTGGTGVQGGYGRSSSRVLVRRETLQLAVDPHAMHGASVDPIAAHVCVRPDIEQSLGGGVIRERLVELESESARHHVGLRWRASVLDDARCLHACDGSDRPL